MKSVLTSTEYTFSTTWVRALLLFYGELYLCVQYYSNCANYLKSSIKLLFKLCKFELIELFNKKHFFSYQQLLVSTPLLFGL